MTNENYYIENKETNKIELHFDKSSYMALSDSEKSEIKSACLFSRFGSCWVSRGFVGSWSAINAKKIAEKLGLENRGAEGERLTFAEQQARKAEKAEARAERYEARSEAAHAHGEALQAPIESMHGDIAFFTQPNINTSAGRAFTNKRNKMWSAWERGFEEFKRSEYWQERAETARKTAAGCEKQSIAFCQRRIDECTASIKKLGKNIESYKKQLERIEAGEIIKRYSGEVLTAETVNEWIDSTIERIEAEIDKSSYYEAMITDQGGRKFDKNNINVGDFVLTERRYCGAVEVMRKGSKNFIGKSGDGWTLSYNYAEITEVVKAAEGEREVNHGFKAGDVYTARMYDYSIHEYKPATITIIKVTADKATVKVNEGRAKAVAIRSAYNGGYYIPVNMGGDHYEWIHPKKDETATA